MPKKKVRFMGLLTNTDSSILGVKLEHGFKIEKIGGRELKEFIMKFEGIPEIVARERLIRKSYLNLEDEKAYVISNVIDDIEVTDKGEVDIKNFSIINEFENKYGNAYLFKRLTLMRLFKEGHLFMPDKYYYFDYKSGIVAFKTGMGMDYIRGNTYSLDKFDLEDLQEFFRFVKIPFKEPSLKLAHENFEISYSTNHKHLSFLTLMMGMESLFNPSGEGELRYRISRNTAVLIGRDKDDSKEIWKRMKKLYDKRCDIVHEGKSDIVTEDDVKRLRNYVRRSIKEFYKIGEGKDKILELLNSCGFGDRPWLKEKPL